MGNKSTNDELLGIWTLAVCVWACIIAASDNNNNSRQSLLVEQEHYRVMCVCVRGNVR